MVDYFVESHGGVKGDEQDHVAIRVDMGAMSGGAEVVPGRKAAMCGDPQGDITNRCGFRQCKSGKNRLICSEDREQLSRVSVHCKLGTRATQNSAYRCWRGSVKFILCSGSAEMCSSRCGKFSPAGEWRRGW
ncbi:hypothetical protein [Gimesia sp.]|uniref:hypothetical protein n=1 Tax=Gimesia sp. TaxID=2024833 RepID=UPI003A91BEB0